MVNKSTFRSILTAGALALALNTAACTSGGGTGGSGGSNAGISDSGIPNAPNNGGNDPTTKTAREGTRHTVGPVGAGPAGSQ